MNVINFLKHPILIMKDNFCLNKKLFGAIGLILLILYLVSFSYLSLQREYLNYGVETDFLGGFVPEAKRFLAGEQLKIAFHPPLYAITLGLIELIVGDWFKTGLILSIFSSFIVLLSTFYFFKIKFGEIAAYGSLLGLIFSRTFIDFSMQAKSDIFFMSMIYSTLVFIALSESKDQKFFWLLSGILIGVCILTRTNGVVV